MASKSGTAVKDGPIDSILISLASFYEGLGQIDGALAIYDFALKCNPACISALANRGIISLLKKQDEKAFSDLNKACSKSPKDKHALRMRGMAYLVTGNIEASIKDFKKALETVPWDSLTVLLAYPALAKGESTEAFQLLTDAVGGKVKATEWPFPILQCLQGEITVTDLLPQASTNTKLLETRAFLGFIKAFSNNPQEGKADLLYVFNTRSGSALLRLMASRGLRVIQEGFASDLAARQEKADRIAGMDFMD